MVSIKQGSIIKINLNPKQGHEQKGYRPYICLSHSVVTKYSNLAIFAPISNTKRDYPFYVPLKDTETTGKVLLDQLVTIDFNARDYRYIEDVSGELLISLLARVKVLFEKG
ncbi:type II toxin-antitoxin system PemK/MazF family toxin [Streptococcus ratti]|uniref:PemK-like protein n=1 Tax=Streptococcus ratti FA-1 = DSM 20564 TaxID=699248 RepID=A0ABP2R339_STRRT|nr:type II toxin-antitoxin system PemK/MazF family toxin [Streptococcus ratti]EJN94704.1 putative PemK-like protein [Streptococcus ratti FA-1 = DSM 20564]EMP69913.1 putative PemK-like protein [Streptococcus ratti FA-1 = DSM 20564]QEY06623.1 type II toxin-antitoxin system PemK/MazF family toxin [Streptococcus ratti]VEI60971.1 ppGpp-regulated growth inhibitor [Streptococcus mutans]